MFSKPIKESADPATITAAVDAQMLSHVKQKRKN